jgi:hypothetical protein
MPNYYMIGCDEDGLYIKGLSEAELLNGLNNQAYGHVEFLKKLPEDSRYYVSCDDWPMGDGQNIVLIIKGHPIVPKAKEVVTKYSLQD